jgi:hypothetical protein
MVKEDKKSAYWYEYLLIRSFSVTIIRFDELLINVIGFRLFAHISNDWLIMPDSFEEDFINKIISQMYSKFHLVNLKAKTIFSLSRM